MKYVVLHNENPISVHTLLIDAEMQKERFILANSWNTEDMSVVEMTDAEINEAFPPFQP